MKTSLKIDLTFEQILGVVMKLSKPQKIKLSKELEKEEIYNKLSILLKTFKTKELDSKIINEEIEKIRQEIYDKKKY